MKKFDKGVFSGHRRAKCVQKGNNFSKTVQLDLTERMQLCEIDYL